MYRITSRAPRYQLKKIKFDPSEIRFFVTARAFDRSLPYKRGSTMVFHYFLLNRGSDKVAANDSSFIFDTTNYQPSAK